MDPIDASLIDLHSLNHYSKFGDCGEPLEMPRCKCSRQQDLACSIPKGCAQVPLPNRESLKGACHVEGFFFSVNTAQLLLCARQTIYVVRLLQASNFDLAANENRVEILE